MKKPKLYVIAGPNGSGKTTFAEKFLPNYADCFEFINADMIAKGLSPFTPSRVAVKAGKILLEQIADCARRKADFAFETTLAGKTYVSFFKKMKQEGYELHLFFLWLPAVKLALARIADRVRKGGHDIPEHDVRRRFARGLKNLFQSYGSLFNTWSVFDNSTGSPEQVFRVEQGMITVHNRLKYDKISKQAGCKNGF
ncbi:MAG: zeta toxin family protein [Candidatus Omnitrophota bacterium]